MQELKERLSKEFLDDSEEELLFDKLIRPYLRSEINDYNDPINDFKDALKYKHQSYSKRYLIKCILKQQASFMYEKTENRSENCTVCFEKV